MNKRTMLAIGATTLGLTLVGAGAASAVTTADGFTPAQWTHNMMHGGTQDAPGFGYGADETWTGAAIGTGDPTTCPYVDEATADQDQLQQRLHDGTGAGDQQRLRDRVDVG
jgi:hypothetical protein